MSESRPSRLEVVSLLLMIVDGLRNFLSSDRGAERHSLLLFFCGDVNQPRVCPQQGLNRGCARVVEASSLRVSLSNFWVSWFQRSSGN